MTAPSGGVEQPPSTLGGSKLLLLVSSIVGFACFVLIPFVALRWVAVSEDSPLYFASAFDLTTFYPGSNRTGSLLPWIGSLGQSIRGAEFVIVAVIAIAVTAGVLAYCWRSGAVTATLTLIVLCAALYFYAIPLYSFLISPGNTYAFVFCLALAVIAIVNTRPSSRSVSALSLLFAVALVVAAVFVNPIAGLFMAIYCGLTVAADEGPGLVTRKFAGVRAIAVRQHRNLIVAGVALISVVVASRYSDSYAIHFPRSVLSNYSVGSYSAVKFSLKNIIDGYFYTIGFPMSYGHATPGNPTSLHVIVWLTPILSAILFLTKRLSPADVRTLVSALLLWCTAALALIAISGEQHVLLVGNVVRGRYFVVSLLADILAFSMVVALLLKAIGFGRLDIRVIAFTSALLAAASLLAFSVQLATNAKHFSGPPQSPHTVALMDNLKRHRATALVGDYWVIWSLQEEINADQTGRAPAVMPITIRSEAFSTRGFQPVIEALFEKGFADVACLRVEPFDGGLDSTPGGDCKAKIAAMVARTGFPDAPIQELDHLTVDDAHLSYFRIGAEPQPGKACTPMQAAMRTTPQPVLPGQLGAYMFKDGSFLVLGPENASLPMTVRVSDKAPIAIEANSKATVVMSAGHKRFRIVRNACRLLIESTSPARFSQRDTPISISQ